MPRSSLIVVVAVALLFPALAFAQASLTGVMVNLVEPGTMYSDRINQMDVRAARLLRFGRTRTQLSLDVYNAFNSSAVQTYNQTYGAAWLTPTLVLPARSAKVSVQLDF